MTSGIPFQTLPFYDHNTVCTLSAVSQGLCILQPLAVTQVKLTWALLWILPSGPEFLLRASPAGPGVQEQLAEGSISASPSRLLKCTPTLCLPAVSFTFSLGHRTPSPGRSVSGLGPFSAGTVRWSVPRVVQRGLGSPLKSWGWAAWLPLHTLCKGRRPTRVFPPTFSFASPPLALIPRHKGGQLASQHWSVRINTPAISQGSSQGVLKSEAKGLLLTRGGCQCRALEESQQHSLHGLLERYFPVCSCGSEEETLGQKSSSESVRRESEGAKPTALHSPSTTGPLASSSGFRSAAALKGRETSPGISQS